MNDYLLSGPTKNPQLLNFHRNFDISQYAFVIQCSGRAAIPLLRRNPELIRPEISNLEDLEDDENMSDQGTPFADDNPTAWIFSTWDPERFLYTFGTSSKCDVVLPRLTQISRRHFAIFLSPHGTWMIANISRYGTWINDDFLGISVGESAPEEAQTESTLNPDLPNQIRVGDTEIIIHPVLHSIFRIPSHTELKMALALLLEQNFESEGTRTTSATETSVIYRISNITAHSYHYLTERKIPVQGESEVCLAIRKSFGQHCIAKIYPKEEEEKAYRQYELNERLRNLNHIVQYDEFVATDTDFRIITPFMDAVTLEQYLGPQVQKYDTDLCFILCKHIADALAWLQENGIVHNDVSEHTMLIEESTGQYRAYLTGFSEFSRAPKHSNLGASFSKDLVNLVSLVSKMLPTIEGRPCCDPQWSELLSQAMHEQVTAREVTTGLELMCPGYEQTPFRSAVIAKTMTIKRLVDENRAEADEQRTLL